MKLRMPTLAHVQQLARELFHPRGDLPRLAIGGAWLFAVGSLLPLLWLIWESGGGLMQRGDVFATMTETGRHSTPLLSYAGWPGMLLIWAELLAVSAAILFTAFPRVVPLKWQRLGYGVLVGWSVLWALGSWRLGVIDPGFSTLEAMFLSALCACTVYRAWQRWTPAMLRASTPVQAMQPSPKAAPRSDSDHQSESGNAAAPNYFADQSPSPAAASSPREQIVTALSRARQATASAARRAATAIRSRSARA